MVFKFLNFCAKPLNDNYFRTEGVVFKDGVFSSHPKFFISLPIYPPDFMELKVEIISMISQNAPHLIFYNTNIVHFLFFYIINLLLFSSSFFIKTLKNKTLKLKIFHKKTLNLIVLIK